MQKNTLDREEFVAVADYSLEQLAIAQSYTSPREPFYDPAFLGSQHCCLIGEKGVGKTLLSCHRALQNHDKNRVLYVSLDHTLFSDYTMEQIANSAVAFGYDLVIFDDVHRYPNWKIEYKAICDSKKVKTIITGSSILSFQDMGGLARRMVIFALKGLSLREYACLKYKFTFSKISLAELISNKQRHAEAFEKCLEQASGRYISDVFNEYLRCGYYAYSFEEEHEANFFLRLQQACEVTLAYEIVAAQKQARPDMARKLQAIFKAVSRNVPYTLNYEDLKTYSGISDLRTLKHYLEALAKSGIIRFAYKPTLKNLRKPDKLFLGNSCLYYAYATLKPDIGSVRETFFLCATELAGLNTLSATKSADFIIDDHVFEIGGPNKSKRQLKEEKDGYLVKDDAQVSSDPRVIPLWMFGLLG